MANILVITESANIIIEKVFHNFDQDNHYYLHSINTSTESILQVVRNHPKYKNIQITAIDNFEIKNIPEDRYPLW